MTHKTIGEILRPTKGEHSYPQIAIRANAWLRDQLTKGRQLPVSNMSSEQVRRIFEDTVISPKPIYLEALAAVQGVAVNELYEAAGYPAPAPVCEKPTDPLEAVQFALRGSCITEAAASQIMDFVKELLDKEKQ